MNLNQFGILITDRCPAACRFCGWRCNPHNKGVISLELAKDALNQAAALGINKRLGITGGEAFLYPELVADILEYGKEAGFRTSSVASNGFWGAWPGEKINRMLSRIEKSCDMICFSLDSFHAEYIPEESVWRAAEAAAGHGITVTFSVADVYGEQGAGPFLASLSEKALKHSYSFYPLQRIGNAENLPEEIFCRTFPYSGLSCNSGGLFSLLYDGRVFPCCNPGVFDTDFTLGNLYETSLADMLEKSRGIRWLRLLRHPKYFRELAACAERKLSISFPEKLTSSCEVCYRIFRHPDRVKSLEPIMEELYQKMVVENFLNPTKEGCL